MELEYSVYVYPEAPVYAVQAPTIPVPDWVSVNPAGGGMEVRIKKLLIPDFTEKPGYRSELEDCSMVGPDTEPRGYWTMNTLICGEITKDGMDTPKPAVPNWITPKLFLMFAAYTGVPKLEAV